MFDKVFQLTQKILKINALATFVIVRKRFKFMLRSTQTSHELLECDEAAQCLTHEDQDSLKREQVRARQSKASLDEFRRCYEEKIKACPEAKKEQQAQVRKKFGYKGPAQWKPETISQLSAKKFLAPSSYLWRSRNDGSWNSRHLDLPIRSCRDSSAGSEEAALKLCVAHTWSQYLLCHGLDDDVCPIKGLFD